MRKIIFHFHVSSVVRRCTALASAALALAACAPQPGPAAVPKLRDDLWELTSTASLPDGLNLPPDALLRGDKLTIDVRVVIDSTGQPDMSTLRVTGSAASGNQSPVEQWLRAVTFRPTSSNPDRRPGLYHMALELGGR